jgi:hypothetical protein
MKTKTGISRLNENVVGVDIDTATNIFPMRGNKFSTMSFILVRSEGGGGDEFADLLLSSGEFTKIVESIESSNAPSRSYATVDDGDDSAIELVITGGSGSSTNVLATGFDINSTA